MKQMSLYRLKELLNYDSETGIFTWKDSGRAKRKNLVAGTTNKFGYVNICIDKNLFPAHRLAWFYVHEYMPNLVIDHKNGNPTDNRISNLREVTVSENIQNQGKPPITNTTGFLGVSFFRRDNKYRASIQVNKKNIHIGLFSTPEEAYEAYLSAKDLLHPTHLRLKAAA